MACINSTPCAFISVINFPHPTAKNIYKTHRLVVLPEFQGIGLGKTLTDEIALHYRKNGKRFRETTSHPARIFSHKNNPKWVCQHIGRSIQGNSTFKVGGTSGRRLTTSWEFIYDGE